MKPHISRITVKGVGYWMCVGDTANWEVGRGETPYVAWLDCIYNLSVIV